MFSGLLFRKWIFYNFIFVHVLSYKSSIYQAMHGAPMYIAETAPSKIRGRLISMKELFIVVGMLVSVEADISTS